MPDFAADKLVPLAQSVIKRVENIEAAPAYGQAPRLARCPLFAISEAIMQNGIALDDDESEVRKEMRRYGSTPFVRFLGTYLKEVEAAGRLVACGGDKYAAFAATIARFLPRAVEENGVAGYRVAVTLDDEGVYVTKYMFLSEAKMFRYFPNEDLFPNEDVDGDDGDPDGDGDGTYSESYVQSVWDDLSMRNDVHKTKNDTDDETNLPAGFCSVEPAA